MRAADPRLGVARGPVARALGARVDALGVARVAEGLRLRDGVRPLASARPFERAVGADRADPRWGVVRADGRLGADARSRSRLGTVRAPDGFERVGATPRAAPALGRARRASVTRPSLERREPVAALDPRELRVERAPGRLIGLPRVVRAAATGRRPTVGTRPARPVDERSGAAARVPAPRAARFGRALRVDGPLPAAPTRGALLLTEATPRRRASSAPRRAVALATDARGAVTAG